MKLVYIFRGALKRKGEKIPRKVSLKINGARLLSSHLLDFDIYVYVRIACAEAHLLRSLYDSFWLSMFAAHVSRTCD